MKEIITDDGSITFYNENVGECYHTKSGAIEESIEKYVKASKIADFAKNNYEIIIYDICFGLGYNSAAAIDEIKNANKNCKIVIFAFENDRTILNEISNINAKFDCYPIIKNLSKKNEIKEDNIYIKLIFGNALEKINDINSKSDFVFFDPFSPKRSPHMWTKKFFKDIYKKMNQNSILTTYSCARIVRDNLRDSGFNVIDGPIIGRRSPSTIAIKNPTAEQWGMMYPD